MLVPNSLPIKKRLFCAVMALLSATLVSSAAALEIHVSPNGSDQQPGTQAAPVKSLEAARKLARAKAGKERVTITVQDGVYYFDKALVLHGEDSGAPGFPVIYRAAHEGKAVLSGGMPLTLRWIPYQNGVFQAKTPPGLELDQLFVDGVRQRMARYPNYDPAQKAVPYRGSAADAISRERAARWADPTGGFIHIMHSDLWGGFDYRITGKNAAGDVTYEGGWQNNRPSRMHPKFRMVENIFEELDAPGEWFHDRKTDTLYFLPPAGLDLAKAKVEGVRLPTLIEFQGSREKPVRFVAFDGFTLRHTARTFMDNKEPLLRSDWTIHRSGTVLFNGAEDCALLNCFIDQSGANAVFVNNYNRRVRLSGLHIFDCGASGVAFVGDPKAVRNPVFRYEHPHDVSKVDRTPGPITDNYPMECVLEDSLIHEVGTVEKQGAGVQISMSRRITVKNCSIYETSRSGININEGTWGGHVIDGCDVFRTVQETGDHGSFNSWGRDRFWVPDTSITAREVAKEPNLPFLDAIEPTTIRNSRWRCDHGWDIDLDDASTNYVITNNLMLNGGLKLREGYRRVVTNNILVNNTLHPHVWYPESGDVFTGNIVMKPYSPSRMPKDKWGREIDRNLFASNHHDRLRFAENGSDMNSVVGDPQFADPASGDFTVKNTDLANEIGFKNFPMDRFGVQKPALKAIAETPEMPKVSMRIDTRVPANAKVMSAATVWMGVRLHPATGSEMSAYGVSFDTKGLAIDDIDNNSRLGGAQGLQKGDLILELNRNPMSGIEELRKALQTVNDGKLQLRVIRNQKETAVNLEVKDLVKL
jgi:hypothetical protein